MQIVESQIVNWRQRGIISKLINFLRPEEMKNFRVSGKRKKTFKSGRLVGLGFMNNTVTTSGGNFG